MRSHWKRPVVLLFGALALAAAGCTELSAADRALLNEIKTIAEAAAIDAAAARANAQNADVAARAAAQNAAIAVAAADEAAQTANQAAALAQAAATQAERIYTEGLRK